MNDFTPHSTTVQGKLTAAGKPVKCQHFIYGMTCLDFDALEARAGGRCEICGAVPKFTHTDHDHTVGGHGVRGLLCAKCNAHMRRVDAGERVADEATARYMANPFWEARGLQPVGRYRRINARRTDAAKMVTFRVQPSVWDSAAEVAENRGQYMSEVIRAALVAYIKKHGKEL